MIHTVPRRSHHPAGTSAPLATTDPDRARDLNRTADANESRDPISRPRPTTLHCMAIRTETRERTTPTFRNRPGSLHGLRSIEVSRIQERLGSPVAPPRQVSFLRPSPSPPLSRACHFALSPSTSACDYAFRFLLFFFRRPLSSPGTPPAFQAPSTFRAAAPSCAASRDFLSCSPTSRPDSGRAPAPDVTPADDDDGPGRGKPRGSVPDPPSSPSARLRRFLPARGTASPASRARPLRLPSGSGRSRPLRSRPRALASPAIARGSSPVGPGPPGGGAPDPDPDPDSDPDSDPSSWSSFPPAAWLPVAPPSPCFGNPESSFRGAKARRRSSQASSVAGDARAAAGVCRKKTLVWNEANRYRLRRRCCLPSQYPWSGGSADPRRRSEGRKTYRLMLPDQYPGSPTCIRDLPCTPGILGEAPPCDASLCHTKPDIRVLTPGHVDRELPHTTRTKIPPENERQGNRQRRIAPRNLLDRAREVSSASLHADAAYPHPPRPPLRLLLLPSDPGR